MKLNPILIFFLFVQFLSAQVQDKVDFKFCGADIYIQPSEKKISGRYSIEFLALENVESIFLDAHDMTFDNIELTRYQTHKSVEVNFDEVITANKIMINAQFQEGEYYTLTFEYRVSPKQTVYFLGWDDEIVGNEQIWTQGQGKYTSHWLPSLDDMTEKTTFDLNFVLQESYPVISNGKLEKKDTLPDSKAFFWQFDMKKPMSSYLLGFVIGDFDKKELKSSSGVPIELYYEPKDSLKVEPTYRYTQHIFDFLEKEIGVPYPWQNYKQVPVQDFLYAGMENTTCTIFSNQYVIDSTAFVDKNYVNVNAHELAHQWFGNLVTETSSEHHWLHEGFATYYAYLAEKNLFGEDHFYWHLLGTAEALKSISEDDQGEALRNPGAGSLTFYEKGAWALAMLHERVGDSNFKRGIRNYLQKYAYQNVTIPDFMQEMENVSGMDLSEFEREWLEDPNFRYAEVQSFLMQKNTSIKRFFELKEQIGEQAETAENHLKDIWDSLGSSQLKQHLVLAYANHFSPGFLSVILRTGDLKVRQAVILSLEKIPAELQQETESLLLDQSYTTIESALYKLWGDFPDNREKYLDDTEELEGFPNKNLRVLWLTLALVTPGYNPGMKPSYFEELNGYTGPEHHFETRLLVFQYLNTIGGYSDETLKNLVEACGHHVWHFKKSARDILKEFLKNKEGLARVKAIYPLLNQQEKQYLDKTLGE
ncbi:M1 family peptidase [Flagellimonas taeanensis]|uniref:M1 family metallopeptidase n=1 Tax=Flagellimonas taeanensis TaxID=1005926 RepID=UPI000E68F963|nr:M1 family metallopeptidase [Allomuricauda taeanensis]RIV47967.1 M1 family peptidase [Allomuricauda taeanensis]